MKKNLIAFYLIVLGYTTCWYSCKEEENVYFLDSTAPAPGQVSDVTASRTPGGAILTYQLPNDKNLSYVKAAYEIQPGVFREAKSSYYVNTLTLEGFGDTLSHQVKIYSVGRNEKASDPLSVDVRPLTPPVKSVFETLGFKATFGGVNVTFKNNFQADLAVVVIVDTLMTGSAWNPVTTFYTDALDGNFSARGFDPIERNFGVYLRDRWNNKSDTLVLPLIPLYEELIDRNNIKGIALKTDAPLLAVSNGTDKLINGIVAAGDIYATQHNIPFPEWFTLDFGGSAETKLKVVLSRFKMFHRPNYAYNGAVPEYFEIWGANDPDPEGGWDGWEKLGSFKSYKPSGLPVGQTNADDIAYGVTNGEDFEFEITPPPVRYIRWKTIDTYGGGDGQVVISELAFWGQVVQ